MEQVVFVEVSFSDYHAASLLSPNSSQEQILMKLFEERGIKMRGDQPAPPALISTDKANQRFVIRQEQ